MRNVRILPRNATVKPYPSAKKPSCRQCKELEGAFDPTAHVVRLMGTWVCNIHLDVKNTRYVDDMLPEIELPHGIEKPMKLRQFVPLGELLVNRAHRRTLGHTHGLSQAA